MKGSVLFSCISAFEKVTY